jgi:hypothetical protein
MKVADFLKIDLVEYGPAKWAAPEIWGGSEIGKIVDRISDESDRARAFCCLHSLVLGACGELLQRGANFDLKIVGTATVQYVLIHGEGEWGVDLDVSYICGLSHNDYDFCPLIAEVANALALASG